MAEEGERRSARRRMVATRLATLSLLIWICMLDIVASKSTVMALDHRGRRALQQNASAEGDGSSDGMPSGSSSGTSGSGYCCQLLKDIGFQSNLPIVILKSSSEILHKVDQDIRLCTCSNGAGFEDYDGPADAAGRGSTSANFAKKSFKVKLKKEDGSKEKFAFLGMPKDNDWILYGPEQDKTQGMRNYLTYNLARASGRYASRTVYVEVFLQDDGSPSLTMDHYNGIYIGMERYRRSNDRIDVAKLKDDDLTGGYILVYDNDNIDGSDVTIGPLPNWNHPFVMKDPDTAPDDFKYITGYLKDFDVALFSDNWLEAYHQFIDRGAFIDYMLLVELTKNPDGYRGSTYMFKDKQKPLAMGPAWDYNEAYGMCCGYPIEGYDQGGQSGPGVSGGSAISPEGWRFNICEDQDRCKQDPTDGTSRWYQRLWEDTSFQEDVARRWRELRSGPWTDDSVMGIISDAKNTISEAVARNTARWGEVLTSYGGGDWEYEVNTLTKWLKDHLAWMDKALDEVSQGTVSALSGESGSNDQSNGTLWDQITGSG